MQVDNKSSARLVEYWRWRYRDPDTGRICRTTFQMSVEEAMAKLPEAERIEGTMLLCEINEDADERL